MIAPGDSIYAFDSSAPAMAVLTPELKLDRLLPLSAKVLDAARISETRLVVNAVIATPKRVGLPLHLIEFLDGTATERFLRIDRRPECEADDAPDLNLIAAWPILVRGSAAEVRGLIKRSGGRIVVNRERSSVQVLGCGGVIVLNLPVDRNQVRILGE